MTATQGHTMPASEPACPVPAGQPLPEPSAAYEARIRVELTCKQLDALRQDQPLAARLAECMLLRELAARLAPVLLELGFEAADSGPMFGRRHGEDESERLVPRGAGA